eukprot:UN16719
MYQDLEIDLQNSGENVTWPMRLHRDYFTLGAYTPVRITIAITVTYMAMDDVPERRRMLISKRYFRDTPEGRRRLQETAPRVEFDSIFSQTTQNVHD